MKPKRIVDRKLLEEVRKLCCIACAQEHPSEALQAIREGTARSHPHHVTSRGAGGDDIAENLMPLCFRHHRDVHTIGMKRFMGKYKTVKIWMIAAKRAKEFE